MQKSRYTYFLFPALKINSPGGVKAHFLHRKSTTMRSKGFSHTEYPPALTPPELWIFSAVKGP